MSRATLPVGFSYSNPTYHVLTVETLFGPSTILRFSGAMRVGKALFLARRALAVHAAMTQDDGIAALFPVLSGDDLIHFVATDGRAWVYDTWTHYRRPTWRPTHQRDGQPCTVGTARALYDVFDGLSDVDNNMDRLDAALDQAADFDDNGYPSYDDQ